MAKQRLTAPKVAGFTCPAGKAQAFKWDAATPGLGLRATPAGKPAYIFQSRFQGKTLRVTIGSPDARSIPQAQERARELQRQIDAGRDPRKVKAESIAADVARLTAEVADVLTVAEVWPRYRSEGKEPRNNKLNTKPRWLVALAVTR